MSNQQQPYNPYPQQQPPPKKKGGCLRIGGIAVLAVLVLGGLAQCMGGDDSASSSTPAATSAATDEAPAAGVATTQTTAPTEQRTTEAPAPEPALEVTAQKMIDDLESNALKAKNTYEGKRVTVSGYVGNIDSSGKYFSVDPEEDAFVLTGVTADLKTDELRNKLADLSKNEKVTVTGKVTTVGEVMGYRITAETIN